MQVKFVAGFGPLVRDLPSSLAFYRDMLGIPLEGDEYVRTDKLDGVRHFGQWLLSDAADAIFGTPSWPADVPVPQANVEFDVESPAAVEDAAAALQNAGYPILVGPKIEPWGQVVLRLLGPEGLLITVSYTPWLHEDQADGATAGRGGKDDKDGASLRKQ
jgi:catechol 2,3-dioxygenase-like lactoylglutathione lyase family enzyme